jgi:hypothetical protein
LRIELHTQFNRDVLKPQHAGIHIPAFRHLIREATYFALRQRSVPSRRTAPLARRAGRVGPRRRRAILLLLGAQTLKRILH